MKTTNNIKKGMLIAMMALVGTTTFAQYRHYGHFHHYGGYYRPIVTTVVTRPAVTTHISNRLSKKIVWKWLWRICATTRHSPYLNTAR